MQKALIQLAFRQVIDSTATSAFEKGILNASYNEFLLKSQAYNQEKKFNGFREMVNNDGRANSLHYKLSFPVLPYIDLLKKQIPTLTDNAGNKISFEDWQFELVDSDINNKAAHKIAITYITGVITVIDTLGEYMLMAAGDKTETINEIEETFVLKMQDGLSITKFRQIPERLQV